MLIENWDLITIMDDSTLVENFADWVKTLGPLPHAPPALQALIMEEIKIIAEHIDASIEAGSASGYDRKVLYEEEEMWSLAAIILRPGQETHPHDHGEWGCAVVLQGVEKDRRFTKDDSGSLRLISERDYPRGKGYFFNGKDIHQPVGADPDQVTVALHFLVHYNHSGGNLREK